MQGARSGDIDVVLAERFGLPAFRAWQREAIEALLVGDGRVLVVAPTGGGKSLTYQLPAAVLDGTTLVLSPLVALMEDQVRSLTARGIKATFLSSTLEPGERRAREAELLRGEYEIVYAAPERLASDAFVGLLSRARIALVAVDEAHCISQWGHDFRPDYLRIGDLLGRLRPPRVLACTATATPDVRAEIKRHLGLEGCREVLRGFARPNLHLAAAHVDGPRAMRDQLIAALRAAIGSPGDALRGAAIVYAATRRQTEEIGALLRDLGYRALVYHAGLDAEVRTRASAAFSSREADVVVATNAFGMGIDRPDIRTVVHAQPPASLEAYYQEVGRAGRDGDPASGLLLCSGKDIALRRRLVELGEAGKPADPRAAARGWSLFRQLLSYLDAGSCRHDFILRYFGDENELLGGCGHCDVCTTLDEDGDDRASGEETTLIVRKALSGVARAQRRAGLLAVAEMLKGTKTEKTIRFGFVSLTTFGLLADRPMEWIVALLRALLAAGWIDLTPTEHPVPYLTRTGVEVMRGDVPARVVLPRAGVDAGGKGGARRARPRAGPDARAEPSPEGAALFEALRTHRAAVARDRRVPPYVVAFDRTLVEMVKARPRTRAELLEVHGMGPARVEQYGAGFLEVIAREG